MKRSTHLLLEDWVRELAKEIGMSVTDLVHKSILIALDKPEETPLVPDKVFLRLGYVPVKLPEQIRRLDIPREEKVYFASWLLEVALKQAEKSGASAEALYDASRESREKR